jgi:hypothetical protein
MEIWERKVSKIGEIFNYSSKMFQEGRQRILEQISLKSRGEKCGIFRPNNLESKIQSECIAADRLQNCFDFILFLVIKLTNNAASLIRVQAASKMKKWHQNPEGILPSNLIHSVAVDNANMLAFPHERTTLWPPGPLHRLANVPAGGIRRRTAHQP